MSICRKCKAEYEPKRDATFCEVCRLQFEDLVKDMGLTPSGTPGYVDDVPTCRAIDPRPSKHGQKLPSHMVQSFTTNCNLMVMIVRPFLLPRGLEVVQEFLQALHDFYAGHLPAVRRLRAMYGLQTTPAFVFDEWNRLNPNHQVHPRL
jgi:hypothetical protein